MKTFLGTVLSAIAVGLLLIAYGLLSTGAKASAPSWNDLPVAPVDVNARGRAAFGIRCEPGQRAVIRQIDGAAEAGCIDAPSVDQYGSMVTPVAYRTAETRQIQTYEPAPVPRRAAPVRVERKAGRDWKKTALVIGGSAGAGAGVGALIGGKKGALIGAAIGGGASSIFEAAKR